MAIGRLSVGVGPKGKAGPHAMYIAREGKYAKHNDKIEKLEATGSGNMPDWAKADPNFFWKMSDDKERKNGTSYREHVIALPRELSPEQRHDLIKAWITQEIGEKHAYQYAIHNPLAMDGGEQPHAHIMFSERLIDGIDRDPDQYFMRHNSKNPEKGGAKKANTPKLSAERKAELKEQRDRWEKMCNSHLELAGSDARISMKTLKEQGIDREPVDLSMVQINKPSTRQTYMDQLNATTAFKQAKIDSLAVNVTDELRIIDKELHERASRAIDGASKAINSYQRRFTADRSRVEGSRGAKLFLDSAIREATTGTDYSKYVINDSKQRVETSKYAINDSKQRVETSKHLSKSADQKINERIAAQAAEKATQERLEQQAAEKLECDRIESRTAYKLLKLQLVVKITKPCAYGDPTLLKHAITPIGKDLYMLLKQAKNKGYDITINNIDSYGTRINQDIAQNPTAIAFERFMLRAEVLSNPDIYNDFVVRLGIREFADKYDIACNSEDLKQLDRLNPDPKYNPPQPKHEQKIEREAKNDYDLDL